MINENDIEFIDRFIQGKLDHGEKLDFEKRVKNDLEFAKEVRSQQKVIDGLNAYGAHLFLKQISTDMQGWKSKGHNPYTPPNLVGKLILKIGIGVVVAAGGYFGYKALTGEEKKHVPPPVEQKDTVETKQPEEVLPESSQEDSSKTVDSTRSTIETEGVSVEEDLIMVTEPGEGSEDAEITLKVEDPASFSIKKLSVENNIHTYEIKADGKTQTIRTTQPNLDEVLTQRANNAIKE